MIGELLSADPLTVGPYRLLGRLGAGGMGQVFLGRSPGGRLVAVKVVRHELAGEPGFRKRFAREVSAARNVSGMFTALVVDADPDADVPWLATAYVPGPSLTEAVEEHGVLPAPSVVGLAAGLAEGLAAIHAAGVVHRDLKPSNVLLAHDGPRVIDFGISRAIETTMLTQSGTVMGSPGFMSPEQADGAPVGPPSDIFSLGAVLTFAATGAGPFGIGPTPALLYRVVTREPDLARVPPELRGLIGRCLTKDPAGRPTAGDLLAELGGGPATDWLPAPLTATLGRFTPPTRGVSQDLPAAWTATAAADIPGLATPGGGQPPFTGGRQPPFAGGGQPPFTGGGQPPFTGGGQLTGPGLGPRGGRRGRLWLAAAAAVVLVAAAGGTAFALTTSGSGQPQAGASAGSTASTPTDPQSPTSPAVSASVTRSPAKHSTAPSAQPTTAPAVQSSPADVPSAQPTTVAPAPPAQTTHKPSPPTTTGSASAVVPNMTGEDLAGAEASLKAVGLTNYSWLYDCYRSVNILDVVTQTPAAGSRVALTAPVHINLQADNCVTMPNVVGFQRTSAVSTLEGLGFTPSTITWRFNCYTGSPPIDQVVTQSPAAGTSYGKTQLIALGVEANNCS
jgi:hypothetical protein